MQKTHFQKLDEWFIAHGMQVEPMGKIYIGRNWRGMYKGHTFNVICSMRRKTKYYGEDIRRRHYIGHEFVVETESSLHTRLTLVARSQTMAGWLDRWLMPKLGMAIHKTEIPALQNVVIWRHDETWTQRFLSASRVSEQLGTLLLHDKNLSATFAIQPQTVSFRTRRNLFDITPAWIEMALATVVALEEMAVNLPAPEKPVQRPAWEKKIRKNPGIAVAVFLLAFFALAIAFPLLLVGIVYLGLKSLLALLVLLIIWRWYRKKRKPV